MIVEIVKKQYKGYGPLSFSIALIITIVFFNYHVVDITMPEVFEDFVKDNGISTFVNDCSPFEWPDKRGSLRYWMLCVEHHVTDYPRIFPLLISSGVLMLSFLLARKFTGSNFAGLVTISFLAVAPIFNKFASSSTYDQSWTFLLMLSLYYIDSRYAVLAYVGSFMSKALSLAFLPLVIMHAKRNRKNMLAFCVAGVIGAGAVIVGINQVYSGLTFTTEKLSNIFVEPHLFLYSIFYSDMFSLSVTLCIIPLLVLLRRKAGATTSLLWVAGIMTISVIIYGFTSETMYAYRLIPLLVFVGMGSGIVANSLKSFIMSKKVVTQ